HALLYRSGMACSGVVIGDVDGDGRPDVFLAGGAGENALFRNIGKPGEIKFEDITEKSQGLDGGTLWASGAAFGDVDGDGDLDLYVCHYDAANALYLNSGDGVFTDVTDAWACGLVDCSHSASFCDYDQDGDLDLYVLTNRYEDPAGFRGGEGVTMEDGRPALKPGYEKYYKVWFESEDRWGVNAYGREDYLLRNEGGKFVDATAAAGISGRGEGNSATWWDFDNDGWVDLHVGNDFISVDRLYRNNRDGTFKNVMPDVVPHTTWFSMGADFGDFNLDGEMDLFIADMSATTHFKQKTTMGVMGGDILRRSLESEPPQFMRNALLINTGTGQFLEGAFSSGLASSDWTWAVQCADYDCDGLIDFFMSNGTVRALNDSDLAITTEQMKEAPEWHWIKDYPPRSEPNRAYRNRGDLQFEDVTDTWGFGQPTVTYATARGDLDGDGDLDLIMVDGESQVKVVRNDLAGGARLAVRLRAGEGNRFGVGARVEVEAGGVTQQRQMHSNRGYMSGNELIAHFGLGTEKKADRMRITWPSGEVQEFSGLEAGYLYTITKSVEKSPATAPGDQVKPMFEPVAASLMKHREKRFDDFSKQPLLPNKLSQLGACIAWGDVDGDGDDDLFLGGAAGQAAELRLNKGQGEFELQWVEALRDDKASEDMGAVFFDADGDGDLDLYVASGSYEFDRGAAALADRLYLNNDGEFERGSLPDIRESSGPVAAVDFDRDGDTDLFVGGRVIPGQYPLSPKSVLLINDGGKFSAGDFALEGMVTSALWSDVDNDAWPDLLVTTEWGPVRLWKNDEGKLVEATKAAGLATRTGWWNSIAAGDVDADGDMDYVVTNFGHNTKYHASDEHPVKLFYGDFRKDGNLQIIEAEYEDGILYPIRGKSCSTRAIPGLADKFGSFKDFAIATLPEIYTEAELEKSDLFSINTLSSGVLINDGSGHFGFRELPYLSQIAPGFGVEVADVDGDARADILLAQNFHGPQAETAPFDGGLGVLLKGDGKGGFEEIWPKQSGIEIRGDAVALTLSDWNDDAYPDILVSRNNDTPIVLGGNSGRFAKVRLAGPSTGARVEITLSNGVRQTFELASGSGYLSQRGGTIFVGLGDSAEITKISSRWPDGSRSSQTGKWGAGEKIVIRFGE
ncbi:MAG: FG-GAP-like repeat-containing protein, partial [Verrucomicrobiales bacterium]